MYIWLGLVHINLKLRAYKSIHCHSRNKRRRWHATKQQTTKPSKQNTGDAFNAPPGHYWASWALTASQGPPTARCSVRPSGPKRLRGRLIPVRPCTFADRVQPPRVPRATERPAARASSWPPAAQVDRLDRARASAATAFWIQYFELIH
ncbi:hypothetical protein GGI42DRAFT_176031 [Trichoderma sp. SZMC 28013]